MNNELYKKIPIGKIFPNEGQIEGLPTNPRTITDEKFEKLKENISKYPEMLDYRSLMVFPHNGTYVIVGGNMRYEALKALGEKEVPCVVLPETTSVEQLKAYAILDNNEFGKWDWDLLANDWDMPELENWGVELPTDWVGSADVNPDEFGDQFCLPDGEAPDKNSITFMLMPEQLKAVQEALERVKHSEEYKYVETFGNANTNGNAIYLIIQQWAGARK